MVDRPAEAVELLAEDAFPVARSGRACIVAGLRLQDGVARSRCRDPGPPGPAGGAGIRRSGRARPARTTASTGRGPSASGARRRVQAARHFALPVPKPPVDPAADVTDHAGPVGRARQEPLDAGCAERADHAARQRAGKTGVGVQQQAGVIDQARLAQRLGSRLCLVRDDRLEIERLATPADRSPACGARSACRPERRPAGRTSADCSSTATWQRLADQFGCPSTHVFGRALVASRKTTLSPWSDNQW